MVERKETLQEALASDIGRLIDVLADDNILLDEALMLLHDKGELDAAYDLNDVVSWQEPESQLLLTDAFDEVYVLLGALDGIATCYEMPENNFGAIKTAYALEHRDLAAEEQEHLKGGNVHVDGRTPDDKTPPRFN